MKTFKDLLLGERSSFITKPRSVAERFLLAYARLVYKSSLNEATKKNKVKKNYLAYDRSKNKIQGMLVIAIDKGSITYSEEKDGILVTSKSKFLYEISSKIDEACDMCGMNKWNSVLINQDDDVKFFEDFFEWMQEFRDGTERIARNWRTKGAQPPKPIGKWNESIEAVYDVIDGFKKNLGRKIDKGEFNHLVVGANVEVLVDNDWSEDFFIENINLSPNNRGVQEGSTSRARSATKEEIEDFFN